MRLTFHTDADVVVAHVLADFDGLGVCFAVIQQEDSAYVYLNRYEQYKDSLDQVNVWKAGRP